MAAPVGGGYVPPVMAGDGRGPYPMMSNAKFNPTMAVIIIVLIGGCFMAGFISVFVRKCMTASGARASIAAATSQGWSGKTRGLDKAAVDALPIVHSADLDEKDDRECPVCLTEFESEDSLRLLPACKHVFHQECIDAWFDAHSTCPLCRASLTGAAAVAQPVETVVEVSENGNESDNDVRARFEAETRTEVAAVPSAGTVSQQEDELRISAAGYPISREDELNSARGMLSRNSQSFKRAARGTTALEKAASFGAPGAAPGTSKPPTVPKPPLTPASMGIRRTSTDLVALRNLLTGDVNSGYRLNRSRSGAAASSSWFARAQSMEPDGPRSKENWSQIDLESGKPSTSKPVDGDDSSWSDRWSLANLRGAVFPLSRSTSDTSSVKSWS